MKPSSTLILTRSDIVSILPIGECIDAVEQAFAAAADARMEVPQVVHLPTADGTFHVKSAAYRFEPHYVAVKVNGNFPSNQVTRGLPTIQGAILLSDGRDGRLLSIMDSIEITALRTAAATAVAARHLVRGRASTASVIGCGVQGRVQLLFLLGILPLERVFVADAEPDRARQFAAEMQRDAGIEVLAVDDFAQATLQSEIIVTCTSARQAFLGSRHISPGTFIAAIGADNHDKSEIEPALMAQARVVVDNLGQCVEMGDLHHAIAAGAMSTEEVVAELGLVVTGAVKPNIAATDIVVFDSTGIAIQDVAAAGVIYERARARGIGLEVELN